MGLSTDAWEQPLPPGPGHEAGGDSGHICVWPVCSDPRLLLKMLLGEGGQPWSMLGGSGPEPSPLLILMSPEKVRFHGTSSTGPGRPQLGPQGQHPKQGPCLSPGPGSSPTPLPHCPALGRSPLPSSFLPRQSPLKECSTKKQFPCTYPACARPYRGHLRPLSQESFGKQGVKCGAMHSMQCVGGAGGYSWERSPEPSSGSRALDKTSQSGALRESVAGLGSSPCNSPV